MDATDARMRSMAKAFRERRRGTASDYWCWALEASPEVGHAFVRAGLGEVTLLVAARAGRLSDAAVAAVAAHLGDVGPVTIRPHVVRAERAPVATADDVAPLATRLPLAGALCVLEIQRAGRVFGWRTDDGALAIVEIALPPDDPAAAQLGEADSRVADVEGSWYFFDLSAPA